mgnify:CR=1 FL=1
MAGLLDAEYVIEGDDFHEIKAPEDAATAETTETAEDPAKLPVTPIGRKSRAQADRDKLLSEFNGLRETITKERETYAERIARIEQENARLHGEIRGYMQRPAQQQVEARPDPGPDPDKLLEEANDALDNKDFAKYQKKFLEASSARARRDVMGLIPQQQQGYQGPPPLNPVLQAVMSQYADVLSDPRGVPMSQAQDRVLEAQGLPDGPDRWNRAFTETRRILGKTQQQRPGFSKDNRAILSGVPSNGSAERENEGPGVRLTKSERETAKKFRMSEEAYAKQIAEMHPERFEK